MKNVKVILFILAVLACMVTTTAFAQSEEGDPAILAMIHEINDQLEAEGLDFRLVQIELFTIGLGRPINRILQSGTRWVPYDARRLAQEDDITYLVDQSQGSTTSGLTSIETEDAIDSAMITWDTQKSLQKVDITKETDPGVDVTVYDWFFGYGGFGNPFLADIVHAGWYPKGFFDAVDPPDGGDFILAMEVTFGWFDPLLGLWTDINGDNYVDTAFSEIYFNDNFNWGIDAVLPGIDVETVALHESGHSLGVGHFGPPPKAVMNPIYDGICQSPYRIDNAGMAALWRSWPNP